MISEKGSLKDTPVMKLLLGIFEQALTGILYIKNEDILKVLYFNRGKVIWAISNSDDDKLENILAALDLVDPNTLRRVKREARVSESIGKILVEKGLITLEELIDSSKIQLKRIIISILKWKNGGFQFVKDAPPERLLSLDLSITNFIVEFILDEMAIADVWKEIGSLQVELIKNPDEEKIRKYRLSEKQTALLESFSGKDKLETVLSMYSGGHRESLLKIVYFFLMSELLIKKEFDLNDSSAFEGDREFDHYFYDEGLAAGKIESMKEFPEQPLGESESFTLSPMQNDEPVPGLILPDSIAPAPAPVPWEEEEKLHDPGIKKTKMASLILVILILLVGGIILLMLNENPMDRINTGDNTAPANGETVSISREPAVENSGPPVTAQEIIPTGPDEKPTPEEGKDGNDGIEEKKNPAEPPVELPAAKPVEKPAAKPGLPPGKSAMDYFREGNMITAGDIWKQELINAGITYSILLELDCQKESVLGAFERIDIKEKFLILNKPARDRTCFLVLWGKYQTKEEAEGGLKLIPQFFWRQANPPEVIDVTKYL